MKKEEQEMEIIVHGEIDLLKIPKDIFDAFIAALEEDICNAIERGNCNAEGKSISA